MKDLSVIFPARSNIKAFYDLMNNLVRMTVLPENVEVLCAIDLDDEVLMDLKDCLEKKFSVINLSIFPRESSEYFTRDYWNFLAEKVTGRFIVNTALGCNITTPGWDRIVSDKMIHYAEKIGDDVIHGLIKDNIPRHGEDKDFPNFSCHPVVSKKHVEILGYLFDERYWAWGCDPAVTILYKALESITQQKRIVSLTSVEIAAEKDIHTTTQADLDKIASEIGIAITPENTETILRVLRSQSGSYQKFLRISQSHPYTMTIEDAVDEARKLKDYINGVKK